MLTTLLERGSDSEVAHAQISAIADTWISVSFNPLGGERNRALTVIKSRGLRIQTRFANFACRTKASA